MLPRHRQRVGCISSEEVAECGPPESVEMLVCAKQFHVSVKGNAGLFPNLADGCVYQALARLHTACGHLRSGFGIVAMFEHE